MKTVETESKIIDSEKSAVLEITKGWCLVAQRMHWSGWVFYNNNEGFSRDFVTFTSNLPKAEHFFFSDESDPVYRFAKR